MKTAKSKIIIALIGATTILLTSYILSYKGVKEETSNFFIFMTKVIFTLLITSNRKKLSCISKKNKA